MKTAASFWLNIIPTIIAVIVQRHSFLFSDSLLQTLPFLFYLCING